MNEKAESGKKTAAARFANYDTSMFFENCRKLTPYKEVFFLQCAKFPLNMIMISSAGRTPLPSECRERTPSARCILVSGPGWVNLLRLMRREGTAEKKLHAIKPLGTGKTWRKEKGKEGSCRDPATSCCRRETSRVPCRRDESTTLSFAQTQKRKKKADVVMFFVNNFSCICKPM